jgi:DNA modification methylase
MENVSSKLADALKLQWKYGFGSVPRGAARLTHGVHPYPAGLSVALAREVLPLLDIPRNGTVLDPFAGAGTVLIEACSMGYKSMGVDASPLATFVASHQTWVAKLGSEGEDPLDELETCANSVVWMLADDIEKNRMWVNDSGLKSWAPLMRALHDLSDTEHSSASTVPILRANREVAHRLWFCASAAIKRHKGTSGSKVYRGSNHSESKNFAYTQHELDEVKNGKPSSKRPKVVGAATACGLFLDAVDAYVRGARELRSEGHRHQPKVLLGDVRQVLDGMNVQFDAVFTSPPYPGVYDYVGVARESREMLTRYAGTNGRALPPLSPVLRACDPASYYLETAVPTGRNWPEGFDSRREFGAYSQMKRLSKLGGSSDAQSAGCTPQSDFEDAWRSGEEAWMRSVGGVLKPGGLMAVMLGDGGMSAVHGRPRTQREPEREPSSAPHIDGLESAKRSALATGLFEDVASASIHGDSQANGAPPGSRRTEHLLLLRRIPES